MSSLPRPPYVDDAWLRAHGVDDPQALFAALRPEDEVMSPPVLRALKATRLSFARSLIQRMTRNRWQIRRQICEIDSAGKGLVVYEIRAEDRVFHFAAASCANDDGTDRLGRFCENEFDFLGSLLDGPVDVERVHAEAAELVSKVWSGRTDNRSFGWTVANRSNRFFDHVVTQLAEGRQPDAQMLASGGGYIVRNAGWYGNGRHGSRSWLGIETGHPLGYPYHIDIFALYLWRLVGFDVAEGMAQARSSKATRLDATFKQGLGIGNSSGIGMVAALVRWPAWVSAFNFLRELALARALSRPTISSSQVAQLITLLDRAAEYYAEQPECPVLEIEKPAALASHLRKLANSAREYSSRDGDGHASGHLWRTLSLEAQALGREAREQLNSLLIDLEPEFADALASLLSAALAVARKVEPGMTVGTLASIIANRYAWALAIDFGSEEARKHFWYRSEENGENRRGERSVDPGVENETFVDVAGAIQTLHATLATCKQDQSIGQFLLTRPELAAVVSRAQLAARLPYSEIRANIIDANFLPMDGIRFLLGTMGLESSHPNNTRWVKGVFLQGAPSPEEIANGLGNDWTFSRMLGGTDAFLARAYADA